MSLKVHGVPAAFLIEAVVWYVLRRPFGSRAHLKELLGESEGRERLSIDELRNARGADAALRRMGVRCLWRAAVVTEMLRRRGVAARVRLTVAAVHPGRAHAEVEVGGALLHPLEPGMIPLR